MAAESHRHPGRRGQAGQAQACSLHAGLPALPCIRRHREGGRGVSTLPSPVRLQRGQSHTQGLLLPALPPGPAALLSQGITEHSPRAEGRRHISHTHTQMHACTRIHAHAHEGMQVCTRGHAHAPSRVLKARTHVCMHKHMPTRAFPRVHIHAHTRLLWPLECLVLVSQGCTQPLSHKCTNARSDLPAHFPRQAPPTPGSSPPEPLLILWEI